MVFSFARPATPAPTGVGYTVRGQLTLYGRVVPQVQYLTDRYVLTRVDRGMFIFLRDRSERLLVDHDARRLRRIEPEGPRIGIDRLRAVIGSVDVREDDEMVERLGYTCRRFRFENANARIVIAGEMCVTDIDGIEATALHAEREFDASNQPFSVPLAPNQVVVESKLRTITTGFEQNQAYALGSIEPGIEDVADLDGLARLAIIG